MSQLENLGENDNHSPNIKKKNVRMIIINTKLDCKKFNKP